MLKTMKTFKKKKKDNCVYFSPFSWETDTTLKGKKGRRERRKELWTKEEDFYDMGTNQGGGEGQGRGNSHHAPPTRHLCLFGIVLLVPNHCVTSNSAVNASYVTSQNGQSALKIVKSHVGLTWPWKCLVGLPSHSVIFFFFFLEVVARGRPKLNSPTIKLEKN